MEVSIVATAYNAELYLERFFTCVLRQTFQNFRLIFIDDCSTDHTAIAAQAFGELLGERFVFLQAHENAGLSASRNLGLDYVSNHPTEYVSLLDVDDWFEDDYLQDLYSRAQESGAGLCIAGVERYDESRQRTLAIEMTHASKQVFEDASACHELAYINPCSYAKLYRFEPIASLRFRPVLRSEDTCYLFEALPYLKSLAFTNKALYHYSVHEGSLTANVSAAEAQSMHEHFKAMMPLFAVRPHAAFKNQFEAQVFIRSSIGGVLRQAQGDRTKLKDLVLAERCWLDSSMPNWRSNPYLSRSGRRAAGTGRLLSKTSALAFAATAYKRGSAEVLLRAYQLFQRFFKRELRA